MDYTRTLGSVLSIFLGLISFALLMGLNYIERRGHYMSISKVKTRIVKQKIKNPVFNVLMHILAYVLFLIYISPVCMIVLFSFTNTRAINTGTLSLDAFTLDNYIMVFSNPDNYGPMLTSVFLGIVSVTLVIILIPWLLPAILISVGLLQTYNDSQWTVFGATLGGTIYLLILGYVVNKIPYTLRMTKAAFYSIDDSLEDAAKNLGAGGFYTFIHVLLPIIIPTILALWALEFNGTEPSVLV